MGKRAVTICLTDGERTELEGFASRRRTAQGLAQRARIILLAAQDAENLAICERLGVSPNTVGKWRRRVCRTSRRRYGRAASWGFAANWRRRDCRDYSPHPSRRPRRMRPTGVFARWRAPLEPPLENPWDLAAFNLQPHRTETFKLSSDPLFVEKVRDIVGLYLAPPERAFVLCVDEKSQIQALERTSPCFPCAPAKSSGARTTIVSPLRSRMARRGAGASTKRRGNRLRLHRSPLALDRRQWQRRRPVVIGLVATVDRWLVKLGRPAGADGGWEVTAAGAPPRRCSVPSRRPSVRRQAPTFDGIRVFHGLAITRRWTTSRASISRADPPLCLYRRHRPRRNGPDVALARRWIARPANPRMCVIANPAAREPRRNAQGRLILRKPGVSEELASLRKTSCRKPSQGAALNRSKYRLFL